MKVCLVEHECFHDVMRFLTAKTDPPHEANAVYQFIYPLNDCIAIHYNKRKSFIRYTVINISSKLTYHLSNQNTISNELYRTATLPLMF